MEAVVASSSDTIINSLTFKPGASASYITEREEIRVASDTGNGGFSPSTQRLMRFRLAGQFGFIDPLSVFLKLDLKNDDAANALTMLSESPLSLFSRCRIIVGNQIVEDIDMDGRLHCMLLKLQNANRFSSQTMLGPGAAADSALWLPQKSGRNLGRKPKTC